MKTYQYQVLKYAHDVFTGEFVNIGVVVFSKSERYLKIKMSYKLQRVTAMFPDANRHFIVSQLKKIESEIGNTCRQFEELFQMPDDLRTITAAILPTDSSALQFSEVLLAVDIDAQQALQGLYAVVVDAYLPANEKNIVSDDEVWTKRYKQYFDRYHVSEKLKAHTVKTNNDAFEFEKAWKNKIWHCYQPISFELSSEETIREKVYKWSGRLQELKLANEELNLVFLMSLPEGYNKLFDFISKKLNINADSVFSKVCNYTEAEMIAKTIRAEMDAHEFEMKN